MRISDWSSDVCSSDLDERDSNAALDGRELLPCLLTQAAVERRHRLVEQQEFRQLRQAAREGNPLLLPTRQLRRLAIGEGGHQIGRASCREECVSTCRSRWSPYP